MRSSQRACGAPWLLVLGGCLCTAGPLWLPRAAAPQVLENVSVAMDLADADGFEDGGCVPLASMPLNAVGHTFTILARRNGALPVAELSNILRFTVKEIDPSTGACIPLRWRAPCVTSKSGSGCFLPCSLTHLCPAPPKLLHTLTPSCCSAGEVEEDGYADEYQLEDLEVCAADYMSPVMVPNFRKAW